MSSSSTDTDSSYSEEDYSFEPSESAGSPSATGESNDSDDSDTETDVLLLDCRYSYRCTCDHCTTNLECVCCREIVEVRAKRDEGNSTEIACITQHPGFSTVCLDVWVLQTAYYQYRQDYGTGSDPPSLHE